MLYAMINIGVGAPGAFEVQRKLAQYKVDLVISSGAFVTVSTAFREVVLEATYGLSIVGGSRNVKDN